MNRAFKIVFLVGMPGVGKTYFGKYAANQLGVDFIDLDEMIETVNKTSIAELFEKGEAHFRTAEISCLRGVIENCKTDTIIATGGGTPCFNDAMHLMNEKGITVWLDADLEYLLANISNEMDERPLFKGGKTNGLMGKLEEIYGLRSPFYGQSSFKVSVYKGLSPDLLTNTLHLSTFALRS